ncbi:MAG: ribosomal RNA small subunit methyltransferase A [Flavobacteriales bacterium]|nr:ribosomal RNA small subunit methyltransferase A [Flavobacteriales bacterium]
MVKPKKHLGQHFLTDQGVARRTAFLADLHSAEPILEIGPGKGILTNHLKTLPSKKIYAIEIDQESFLYLEEKNVLKPPFLIKGDFLSFDLDSIFKEEFILIGNYPYNISSQIVFKMLEKRKLIPFMAGMFQKEVALRLASKPNSKNYGILSVLTQAFYQVNVEFKVAPGAFFPPPKVDSAVITCSRNLNYNLDCDEKLFYDVVKTAFNQRRKTLLNSLSKFNLKKAIINHPFAKLRPENLSVDQFVDLTKFIQSNL